MLAHTPHTIEARMSPALLRELPEGAGHDDGSSLCPDGVAALSKAGQ